MVPRCKSCAAAIQGFPRPRGDGPLQGRALGVGVWVPPPTRGWSPSRPALSNRYPGSPAHAGMVLRHMKEVLDRMWFPRPRGDGPVPVTIKTRVAGVPPPTRGWSRFVGRNAQLQLGSPAHAGMDPLLSSLRTGSIRFPRPRGDGPVRKPGLAVALVVPPPTRGWYQFGRAECCCACGSPAHAEMVPGWCNPRRLRVKVARIRFPHLRGDGPPSQVWIA